jgi:hypothetical protein
MIRTAKTVAIAIATGAMLVAGGCLTIGDDEEAILHIELYWDEKPGNPDFEPGSCHSADVHRIDWALIDEEGDEVVGERDDCRNAIEIIALPPGEYSLEISGQRETGVDALGNPIYTTLWYEVCTEMRILRFDEGYYCDIDPED